LGELRLEIFEKQWVETDDGDKGWLFLIGKKSIQEKLKLLTRKKKSKVPSEERCIPIFCESDQAPLIFEEDEEIIRRRFPPKEPKSGITGLGLSK